MRIYQSASVHHSFPSAVCERATHHQAEITLRQIYTGRVKVGALVESREHDGARQAGGELLIEMLARSCDGLD